MRSCREGHSLARSLASPPSNLRNRPRPLSSQQSLRDTHEDIVPSPRAKGQKILAVIKAVMQAASPTCSSCTFSFRSSSSAATSSLSAGRGGSGDEARWACRQRRRERAPAGERGPGWSALNPISPHLLSLSRRRPPRPAPPADAAAPRAAWSGSRRRPAAGPEPGAGSAAGSLGIMCRTHSLRS